MIARLTKILPWLVSLLGVAPYLLIFAVQAFVCPPGHTYTGFLGYDQASYLADGRAVFERGNGIAYPNPYDPDPAAPVIYFYWLIWMFGLGVCGLGLDPGWMYLLMGVLAAIVFSRLTLKLVERCGATGRFRVPVFCIAM